MSLIELQPKFPFSPLIRRVPKPQVVGAEAGRVVPRTQGRTGRRLLLHALLRRGPVRSKCAVGGKCDSLASQRRRAFIEELFTVGAAAAAAARSPPCSGSSASLLWRAGHLLFIYTLSSQHLMLSAHKLFC